MIFSDLEIESIIQVGDQTRLSALKSFVSKDEDDITKVEIQPEATASWIDVTGADSRDWYLDWRYTGASRDAVVSARVTAGDAGPTTVSKTIQVISAADDKLFSSDQDLASLEPNILKYVSLGRATFLNVHRAAQTKILESLDESGIIDTAGAKLTKAAVVDVSEVRGWSRDLTLHLIFKSLINSNDDVFTEKAKFYLNEAAQRKSRSVLRLDLNDDGELDVDEKVTTGSMNLVRR